MNNRLEQLQKAFPMRSRPLLMTGLVVGDPFAEATGDYMRAVVRGGADAIELLVPFSDPVYHGPVMRRSARRAMSEKVTWEQVEKLIADFRAEDDDTAIIVSSYLNRVLARGIPECAQGLAEAGADAVMVTDLPAEEAQPLRREVEQRQLVLVQTVAPTTTERRFRRLASDAHGVMVWTGHTGAEIAVEHREFHDRVRKLRKLSSVPIVASMNVESGGEAAMVAKAAHGVLVGSALSWLIEGKGPDVDDRLEAFVDELRLHLDGTVE